jgi:hypothetical protein
MFDHLDVIARQEIHDAMKESQKDQALPAKYIFRVDEMFIVSNYFPKRVLRAIRLFCTH